MNQLRVPYRMENECYSSVGVPGLPGVYDPSLDEISVSFPLFKY